MNIIQTLLNADLFQKKKVINRHSFLTLEGDIDSNIYYVEKGSLRIFIRDENQERTIRFGYKENIIVCLDSFLSEKTTDFYIQAIKKTEIKVASKKDFYEFIKSSDDNLKLWTVILEDLVLQQIEREKDLLINSPRQRYERVLKRSPKLFQEYKNFRIDSDVRDIPKCSSYFLKV